MPDPRERAPAHSATVPFRVSLFFPMSGLGRLRSTTKRGLLALLSRMPREGEIPHVCLGNQNGLPTTCQALKDDNRFRPPDPRTRRRGQISAAWRLITRWPHTGLHVHYLIGFLATARRGRHGYPHVTDEETEAPRGKGRLWLRS